MTDQAPDSHEHETFSPRQQDTLEAENFIETYQIIAEWIRFADAKAAVVLTALGALASLLIPTFKPFLQTPVEDYPQGLEMAWYPATIGLFFGWMVFAGGSCVYAFLCINPFRRKGRHPSLDYCKHFHPAAIAVEYRLDESERFIEDCEQMGMSGLKREVVAGLLIDSHISGAKYARVTRSITMLGISAVFAVLYTLSIQLSSGG